MTVILTPGQLFSNCSHTDLLKHGIKTGVCIRGNSETTPMKSGCNWDFGCSPEIFLLQGHCELQLQHSYRIKNRFLIHACVLQKYGVAFTKHTPIRTKCKFIAPISKCKHAWDFACDKYHWWIYTCGNWNWIPAECKSDFIPYRNTNVLPKIT